MRDPDLLTDIPELPNDSPKMDLSIHAERQRFPFCIVWTPLPILTYILPFIGHMGIATSTGVIRDFAGPYYVSEDNMAFGKPTKYWQLDYTKAKGGVQGWDAGVMEASEIYKARMHNLCCDNCHSHVATALNLMSYGDSSNWNMVKLAFLMLIHGKFIMFVSVFWAFLRPGYPFSYLLQLY
ncbi:PREDICTED: transmembrane protein 222 isoform X3 [Vollenhovia emeryi]|uniref:transmembrane protein 222 isoform X3 n=1 Tax=Vollenhovia emeryi TaxID=411798 RepID=UPI0005F3C12A|nr:PREDICTED: transmembrane protein 222 isoform X3 [Vollenhovia emeryi]